jgi:feruloyl esterase
MNAEVNLIVKRTLLPVFFCLSTAAFAQPPCDQIKSLAFPGTVITDATVVAAGPYRPAGASEQAALQLPAYCRIAATLKPSSDSEIAIEVWMPATDWNGKFEAVGGGGWAGVISYGAMALALQDGYATASTDTGHKGGDAVFALGHPEKVIDFSYRAVHEMTVKAKAFMASFYGRTPRLSYWNGCSTGGRQGLMEAQRYPEDFDGIVAGAPANYQTHLHAWSVAVGMAALKDKPKDKESALAPADLALLHKAVLAACDTLDGVRDGLLTDPRKCHFDPASLRCRTSGEESCLTDAQVEAVKKIYAPLKTQSGQLIFPSMMPGSELGWTVLAGGPEPVAVATGTFKYVARQDANWDWHNFDADKDTALADASDIINATSPDLRAFESRGGKLLMYHGWNDQLIAPENSINYYSSVLEKMGPNQDNWYRLFMLPGMQHCRGGPGPNQFNVMGAMERWRESNTPPAQIVATHVTDNRVDMTRPLCPYPQVAEWTGIGNINDAANFVCRVPK